MPLNLDRMIGTPFFRKGAQRRPYARYAYARPEQRGAAAGADARRLERLRNCGGRDRKTVSSECPPSKMRCARFCYVSLIPSFSELLNSI